MPGRGGAGMLWLALPALKSLESQLSLLLRDKPGLLGGESWTYDTCARINIFGINNGSWGI